MTERDFIYWLQGSLELGDVKTMNEKQVQILKDHLALVMQKVTPNYNPETVTYPTKLYPEGTFDPVILPTTYPDIGHWETPRNPLQDLPFYKPETFPIVTCSTAGTADGKLCSDSTASTLECTLASDTTKSQLKELSPEQKAKGKELLEKMVELNKRNVFSGGADFIC